MNLTVDILRADCRTLKKWTIIPTKRTFWRLWWNKTEGAEAFASGRHIELNPDRIVLIAPQTPLSSVNLPKPVTHLYVHFQLGPPLEVSKPGIHIIPVDIYQCRRSPIHRNII